jgi:repressor of nif and glnA expression
MDQINFLAYDSVIRIIKQAKMADLGSCFPSGEIDDSFLRAPI